MCKEYDFIYCLELYLLFSPQNRKKIEIPHLAVALLTTDVLHRMNEVRYLM